MQELPARLDALLVQAQSLLHLSANRAATEQAWQKAWLSAAVQRWLMERADLAAAVQPALAIVPRLFADALTAESKPWLPQPIPVRQLVELAIGSLRGFDAFSGRRSETLPTQITDVLTAASDGLDAGEACQQLGEILRRHAADVRPLEQQLINKERQQRQQLEAARGATRVLQERIGDRQVPDFAVQFFDGELRKLLQVVHLQHGESSTAWTQLLGDVDTLIWALIDADAEALRTAYGGRVSQSQQQLREQFSRIHHNAAALDEFFDAFDFYLLSRMSGQQPTLNVMPWAPQDDSAHSWSQTGDALLKARALRVGDWVELQLDMGAVRARLIDKDLNRGIYLFANLSGLRVARLTVAELTERFAERSLRVIDARPMLLAALPTLVEELENRLLQLQLDSLELAAQQRQQQAERLQRELDIARAEQAEQAAKAEAEREAQARADAEARLLAECRQDCRRLQPGAWIELRQGDVEISAQLAVILNRTGELVFVDRQGRKLLQADPDTLADQLLRGELRIREYGRALDDALKQLVADQRQRMGEWHG